MLLSRTPDRAIRLFHHEAFRTGRRDENEQMGRMGRMERGERADPGGSIDKDRAAENKKTIKGRS
jgi:hypothetical protein